MSRWIQVAHGVYATIDDEDYPLISGRGWYLQQGRYARTTTRKGGTRRNVLMHHMVLDAHGLRTDPNLLVDHINGDGLDNRKENLRVVPAIENCRNRRLESIKGGWRGVHKSSKVDRWEAAFGCGERKENGKARRVYLGLFATQQEAAIAVDLKLDELGWVSPRNFATPDLAEEAILSAVAKRNRELPTASPRRRNQIEADNARAMDLLREVLRSRRAA